MKTKPMHSFSFLMEFLIILLFFALSATICVRLYSASYAMNSKANQEKLALEYAQNYIESNQAFEPKTFYVDKNFKEGKEKVYKVTIVYQAKENPHYVLTIRKASQKLLSLTFYKEADA